MNYNVFGVGSNDKIDQVIRKSKGRNFDSVMISSLDTRWETVKKSTIENKLKIIASNFFKYIR